MKPRRVIFFLLCIVSMLYFSNCNKNNDVIRSNVKGKITLNLNVNATINISHGRTMTVNTDSFKVVIYNASGTVVKTFEKYTDVPQEIELDTGAYYVVAHSNNEAAASFENAYYYGQSVVFQVSPKQVVSVTVTCELYNFFITVEYTANVTGNCNDWSTKIWNDEDTLEYLKAETRNGYFKVAPVSILAMLTYTKNDSSTGTINIAGSIGDPHRKTHYIITIDAQVNGSNKPIEIYVGESSEIVNLLFTNYDSTSNKVIDIEGNIYNTVQIGTQLWMKENLKTTKYRNGDAIPNVTDNAAWSGLTTGAYCWYNNDSSSNKNTYGALYNFYTVVDSRNLCPSGWHVPNDDEWTTLTTYLGGDSLAGGKLKETGTTHWESPNTGATNGTGFTALPGGYRAYNGPFSSININGDWWSSTYFNTSHSHAFQRYLSYNTGKVDRNEGYLDFGFSVRCVKD